MSDNKTPIILIVSGVAGFILLGVFFVKLIIEIIKTPFQLFGWFLTFVNILITIVGVCLGVLSFILLLIAIVWSIEKLWKRISGHFINLGRQVSELLKNKPERILPFLIAAVSETFILMLSKNFTTNDTKAFLSLMLLIILAIISITVSREKKRFWGGIAVVTILILTSWLVIAKYQITYSSLAALKEYYWRELPINLIDLLSIGLVVLSFVVLIALALFYSFKKV